MNSSYYNIFKEVDTEKGLYLVVNAYTHALDIINKNVYNFLTRKDTINNIISDKTLEKLEERGFLTSLSKEEEIKLVNEIAIRDYNKRFHNGFNFYFILSYDCNFRCTYCYESSVLRDVKLAVSKKIITKEYVDKAFDIISDKIRNGQSERAIHLYGGEPFLKDNREIIEYIFQKAKVLNLSFTAISNGYDIDSYFDIIKDYKAIQFQITIDGIDEVHNSNRPHFKNNDSFEKVTNNIGRLLKDGIYVSVRMNTNSESIKKINEILSFFKKREWLNLKNFRCYVSLLRPEIKNHNKSVASDYNYYDLLMDFDNNKTIKESYEEAECQDFGAYKVLQTLLLGEKVSYRSTFCGAQNNTVIFDPEGDVYSCWDVVGQKENVVGKYIPNLSFNNDSHTDKWFRPGVSNTKCSKCKYVLFCGGGCSAVSFRESGEISLGNCNDYHRIFRFMMKALYDNKIKNNLQKWMC